MFFVHKLVLFIYLFILPLAKAASKQDSDKW